MFIFVTIMSSYCNVCKYRTTSGILLKKHQVKQSYLKRLQSEFVTKHEFELNNCIRCVHIEIQEGEKTVDDLLVTTDARKRTEGDEKEMIQEWLLQKIQSNRVLSLMACTHVLVKQIKKMMRKVRTAKIK